MLAADLTVTGNIRTQGDIQIEGTVEGDIRARLMTVGESATLRGEIVADEDGSGAKALVDFLASKKVI